jgi:hypothetical protein
MQTAIYYIKALTLLAVLPNRYAHKLTKWEIAKKILKRDYRIHWITG